MAGLFCRRRLRAGAAIAGAMDSIGRTRWAIAEGYIPGQSHGPAPELESHEACCILNPGDVPAQGALTVYLPDREPARPHRVPVEPRRTLQLRLNALAAPEPVPREAPSARAT